MADTRSDHPLPTPSDADRDKPELDGAPSHTQVALKSDPHGEAEAARIASGTPGEDATDATEAETPVENLRRIGGTGAADEAIERATAAIGDDEA